MATVSVFPPAANIVWSDARGSYGIANAVLAPPVLLAAGPYAAVKTGRLEYIRED